MSDMVGPIVLIGDNLRSYFSKKVLQYCDENEIQFLCLPPNSTIVLAFKYGSVLTNKD